MFPAFTVQHVHTSSRRSKISFGENVLSRTHLCCIDTNVYESIGRRRVFRSGSDRRWQIQSIQLHNDRRQFFRLGQFEEPCSVPAFQFFVAASAHQAAAVAPQVSYSFSRKGIFYFIPFLRRIWSEFGAHVTQLTDRISTAATAWMNGHIPHHEIWDVVVDHVLKPFVSSNAFPVVMMLLAIGIGLGYIVAERLWVRWKQERKLMKMRRYIESKTPKPTPLPRYFDPPRIMIEAPMAEEKNSKSLMLLKGSSALAGANVNGNGSLNNATNPGRRRVRSGAESAEWANSAIRGIWHRFEPELNNYFTELLRGLFKSLQRPSYVESIYVEDFTIGETAPRFTNVQIRRTRADDSLQYQFQMRNSGNAKLVLSLKLRKEPFLNMTVPVVITDLDMEAAWWCQLKFISSPPWVGKINLAFAEMPCIDVSIQTFNAVNLMSVPGLRTWLKQIFTYEVPKLLLLPLKADINLTDIDFILNEPPRTQVTREYKGVLKVMLREAVNLRTRRFMRSTIDPFARLTVGDQCKESTRTSKASTHSGLLEKGHPVWNQYFEFLVKNPKTEVLTVELLKSASPSSSQNIIGICRFDVGKVPSGDMEDRWVFLEGTEGGLIHMHLTFEPFVEELIATRMPTSQPEDSASPVPLAPSPVVTLPTSKNGTGTLAAKKFLKDSYDEQEEGVSTRGEEADFEGEEVERHSTQGLGRVEEGSADAGAEPEMGAVATLIKVLEEDPETDIVEEYTSSSRRIIDVSDMSSLIDDQETRPSKNGAKVLRESALRKEEESSSATSVKKASRMKVSELRNQIETLKGQVDSTRSLTVGFAVLSAVFAILAWASHISMAVPPG
mmetsp:Transcript_30043/g.50494  ORF Transcript_30043/g.50494 Transcript_30043/m.50494 type:complete len:838 (+) Transcript_30043:74-2587(+)